MKMKMMEGYAWGKILRKKKRLIYYNSMTCSKDKVIDLLNSLIEIDFRK
jgi:hypothetical protein